MLSLSSRESARGPADGVSTGFLEDTERRLLCRQLAIQVENSRSGRRYACTCQW
jgi:hypothetical protein